MNFNGGYPLAGTVNSEVNCLVYMLSINMHIVMMTSTFLSVCLCCQKSPNSDSIFLAALIWVFLYCARSTHCAKWGKSARSWLGKSILKSFVQTLMISASFRFVVIVHVSIGVCTRNSTGLQRTTAPHHFPFSCQIKVSLPHCWTCNDLLPSVVRAVCYCYYCCVSVRRLFGLIKKLL